MQEKQYLNNQRDHEIDLRETIKLILEYKKSIILIVLIFTTVSIIFSISLKSSFISSTQIEIGYLEAPDGTQKLIENPDNLIADLKILRLKNLANNFSQNLSMKLIEGKVIQLKTTSSSAKQNENFLTDLINYIIERHSKLEKLVVETPIKELNSEVEKIKAEINYFTSKLSDEYQSNYLNIMSNLQKEDQSKELLKLLYANSKYKDHIFLLNQKLADLTYDLENSYYIVRETYQLNDNIETNEIKPKTKLTIFLGAVFGFFTGIFLVFIRNFLKSFKES